MDQERFLQICQEIDSIKWDRNGIGTLKEKTVHAILKNYYEPDKRKHEVRVGRYIADIFTGTEIVEIQTRQLNKLREKLKVFLEDYPVTIVSAIYGKKWIYWVELETGKVSKGRVSPKHGSIFDAFYELYKIKPFLIIEGITIRIPVLTIREYKCLDGWSKDRKKGATRLDRVPMGIEEEIVFQKAEDYAKLIPAELEETFTCKEFAQCAGISLKQAQIVVPILSFVGSLKQSGKKGRAYLYMRNKKFSFLEGKK